MKLPDRTFEESPAKRERVPLLIGLVGPSSTGKTYSALRLATGIQRIVGGDIRHIDTEAKRALHYAEDFRFIHVPFGQPFGPLDYLAVIDQCVRRGSRVIVIDSMSHEHEGPGGVLEQHEAELDRLAGDDWKKRERVNMLAWAKPKQARRRLINTIVQMQIAAIFCFRAKDKIKPAKPGSGSKEPIPLGWQPIAGEEFMYEMTTNALLLPGVPGDEGYPQWQPEEDGEKAILKLPKQFRHLFTERRQFSEDIGEAMAKWAEGESEDPRVPAFLGEIDTIESSKLPELAERLRAAKLRRSDGLRCADAMKARRARDEAAKSGEVPPEQLAQQPGASE